MSNRQTKFRLKLVLAWSFLALGFERLSNWLFPAVLFPVLFVALALFGVFDQTGDPVRLLVLSGSVAGFVYYLWRGFGLFTRPLVGLIETRAEADGGLAAGTLAVLHDQPEVVNGKAGQVLWQAHQQNMARRTNTMRVQLPHAVWAKTDRWALRVLAVLVLFSGFVFSGASWTVRLGTAFHPAYLSVSGQEVQIEAWINPPKYSGQPPIFITLDQKEPLIALPGSEFAVRVSGARRSPRLLARLQGGASKRQKLESLGNGVFEGKTRLQGETDLILSGGVGQQWHIDALVDTPPEISFTVRPQANALDELAFTLFAKDDFGIEQVVLVLETDAPGDFVKTDQIDLPVPKAKTLDLEQELDLTRHVLAGLSVQIRLQATDGAGHSVSSEPVQIKLPKKLLIQPLARALAEQRLLVMRDNRAYDGVRQIVTKPVFIGTDLLFTEPSKARLNRAPANVRRATALMGSVMRAPQTGIKDPFVWLGMSYVHQRLYKARHREDLDPLEPVMWELTLRAEGGELESAAAALKLAEKALQTALLLSDPPSEVERLSQKYELAVQRYLQALAKQALKDGQTPPGGAGGAMSADQLQEMLDALQALAQTGANMDARSLLKALAALLENMKMQLAANGQGDGEQDDMVSEAMRKALEELGEMLGKQKELLDDTQRQQSTENAPGQPGAAGQNEGSPTAGNPGAPSQGLRELSQRQGALQGNLNELAQSGAVKASQADPSLEQSAEAMGEAARALAEGDALTGLMAGQKAFSQMREGAEALAGEMLERQQGQKDKARRDPFGRASNGGMESAEGTDVPDMVDPQQARKILQEIRRRAAEQSRDTDELEYLDRLLERF